MLEEAINSLPGDMRHRVGEALRQRVLSQCDDAFVQSKAIARENNSREYRHTDGLGEMRASIPATAAHYWTLREGEGIWSDKKFVKRFLQDNPEAKVKSVSSKAQVGYTGGGFFQSRMGRKVKVYK